MLTALPPRPRQFGRLADLAVPENFHDPLPGLESSGQEGNSPIKLRFFPTIPTPQFRHCDVTPPKWAQSEQEAASNPGSHVRHCQAVAERPVRRQVVVDSAGQVGKSAPIMRRELGRDWNNDGSHPCLATLAVL